MRELKFRAWDDTKKEWTLNIMECVSSSRGDIWLEPALKSHDVIIEQYTGLKDKNSKEIYEGDIVQIDSMDELRIGYVELVADQYCIVCGEEDGHKIVAEFYYYSKPEENCKVIGNIHENPELLEQEDGENR